MSNNKNKYFIVNVTAVVKADNMADAKRAATSRGRISGTEVLARSTSAERSHAGPARNYAESLNN